MKNWKSRILSTKNSNFPESENFGAVKLRFKSCLEAWWCVIVVNQNNDFLPETSIAKVFTFPFNFTLSSALVSPSIICWKNLHGNCVKSWRSTSPNKSKAELRGKLINDSLHITFPTTFQIQVPFLGLFHINTLRQNSIFRIKIQYSWKPNFRSILIFVPKMGKIGG